VTLKQSLEQDINRFFEDIKDQLPEGKKKTLMLLVDKYIHLSTTTTLLDNSDLVAIKGQAISLYNDRSWPKKLGKFSIITGSEIPQICLVEATINFLHANDFLKRTPKFDYKE